MNAAQKIQVDRLRLSTFNNFDGNKVADDLIKNESCWVAFVWGRFEGLSTLIELRDLETGRINAGTLYLLVPDDKITKMQALATKWKADEMGYIKRFFEGGIKTIMEGVISEDDVYRHGSSVTPEKQSIFRIWWD